MTARKPPPVVLWLLFDSGGAWAGLADSYEYAQILLRRKDGGLLYRYVLDEGEGDG